MRTSLILAVATLALAPAAAQSTWYVDAAATPPGTGTAGEPYASIQFAHDQALTLSGDTLSVAPGSYTENLTLSKRVRVEAQAGPDATHLRGAAPGALVAVSAPDISPTAALVGFTLDGSAFPDGTGVRVQSGGFSAIRLEGCVVRDFSSGTALYVAANMFIDAFGCTVARNAVGAEAAPAISFGLISLQGCIARGNTLELVGDPISYNPFYSNVIPSLSSSGTNVTDPPRFWNLAEGDLRLRPNSPCIDAAGPSFPPDPDGSPADMGAFPFDPAYAWGPSVYCSAKPASAGCLASVTATGTASASGASGLVIDVTDVLNQKLGIAFYGSGAQEQPFQGGTLCVLPPTTRTPVQSTGGNPPPDDCSGSMQLDFGALLSSGAAPQLGAGSLVYVQFWYRDPADPTGFGSALSNAVGFGIAP